MPDHKKIERMRRFAMEEIPKQWLEVISKELETSYFQDLLQRVDEDYKTGKVFPPQSKVFEAFKKVDKEDVKVVILGQDPYHGERQANGLSFSVSKGVDAPPSLKNIFKELELEFGKRRENTDLSDWAAQGVLMLNAVLSVQAGAAGSHAGLGWERFTDKIIEALNNNDRPVVFLLWGNYAIKKAKNINQERHLVLTSPHPSPLSAHRGFLGNDHFRQANIYLKTNEMKEIKWI